MAVARATASGGAARNAATKVNRAMAWTRSERRLSGPDPNANRRMDRRRRVSFDALIPAAPLVGGSSSGFMTARGAADFLTRSTAVLGGLFILLSIALAAYAGATRKATT